MWIKRKYLQIKEWATFKRVTKTYLWYKFIVWVLRWVATAIFLWWVWNLAPPETKDKFRAKYLGYETPKPVEEVQPPLSVQWANRSMIISSIDGVREVYYGLREDGIVVWKDKNNKGYKDAER